jgi:hypothetical protein
VATAQIFDISDHLLPQPERLQTEDGDATRFRAVEWDTTGSAGVLVNRSVWTSVEAFARRQFHGDGRHFERGAADSQPCAVRLGVPRVRRRNHRSVRHRIFRYYETLRALTVVSS